MPGIDANTRLLVRATGADGSTGFTDVSQNALTLTAGGSAQVDTAIKKFTASVMLETSGDNLTMTLASALGTGDFAIDFWAYFSSVAGVEDLFGATSLVNTAVNLRREGAVVRAYITGGGEYFDTTGHSFSTGTWYHIAFQRVGTAGRCWIDGVQRGSQTTNWNVNLTHTAYGLGKGRNGSAAANMQIEELRISNVARYDTGGASFTPETAPYSASVTMTADAGSYTLTGVAATLNAGKTIFADAGAYVLSGIDAVLKALISMPAAAGSYTLTGIDAFLAKGQLMVADVGTYVLTGISTLQKLTAYASPVPYVLTGINAAVQYTMNTLAGAYSYLGIDAVLRRGSVVFAGTGSYIVTGLANIMARASIPQLYKKARNSYAHLKGYARDVFLKE